jgi:carbonic anhydrase/acetyltransferase-like protein (isoleucine patch superfamily)
MSIQSLVVLGASNAFWEIHELVQDVNERAPRYRIIAVLDDDSAAWGRSIAGVPVAGSLESARDYPDEVGFVFGIGSYRTRLARRAILSRVALPDERFVTLVHPTAKVFSTAAVAHGCIIHYGTVIFGQTTLEPFVIVSATSVIATNNLLGRGALVGSGVITAHRAAIGCYAHIGQGTLIGERCEVGPGAQIGMGGVVLQHVKAGAFGIGNPLRFIDRVEVPAEIAAEWQDSKDKFQQEQN